jgi:DivIVA domain-containing protein
MTATFKRVPADTDGYETTSVDHWIDLARQQFSNPASHVLDASTLRNLQFAVEKGGYDIKAVDSALDRLDDAFAEQEANRLLVRNGHDGARAHVAQIASLLFGRIERPARKRFTRQSWFRKGYSVAQVDALLTRLDAELAASNQAAIGELRQVTFSPRWAGYTEAQVDAFIDRAIQYLQLSKTLR